MKNLAVLERVRMATRQSSVCSLSMSLARFLAQLGKNQFVCMIPVPTPRNFRADGFRLIRIEY